ncbi:MAG: class I SAM-dependent methyltransferase [Nitrospirales bacterium]|nr:class I SAM-dependent methyltransferase [Nitrospira sp.]MDR4501699.1 class I SAM-dependent methyltransferase [Nitrospirales bacterium]
MPDSLSSNPTTQTDDALTLEGEILTQRAWRMPDLIIYQHGPEEWWVSPLDEDLPLIKLNRMGASLLGAMDGRSTLATLLSRFGKWVCGPNQETGQWFLERWALPRYSLCFYGTEAPSGHNTEAKWDLLLQKVREKWHGNVSEETEDHLSKFHMQGIQTQHGHFEIIETTVSHLFREPCEALHGLTYGRLLGTTLRQMGWFSPRPTCIVEVGAGLGYVSKELAGELSAEERAGMSYTFLDLTKPFLGSQTRLAQSAGWQASAIQANAEQLPFRDGSVDLIIDNENLADMTPVQLTAKELETHEGTTPQHQAALDLIRRLHLPLDTPFPDEIIFNFGALSFLMEAWRVLKPGGHAIMIEFGIETGYPEPVKLPGHTEYEVQYSHMRHAARGLGFREQYCALPQLLNISGNTQVLCTGAAYAIRRICASLDKPFSVRAYTHAELKDSLGETLPKLTGLHYHSVLDPAWFGLWDFKVLMLEKPGAKFHRPNYQESKGFRWYSQR